MNLTIDKEILGELGSLAYSRGDEVVLTPILSKTKPEPFYGWKPLRVIVDRYEVETNTLFDSEGKSFSLDKYKAR